jgi:motility quorum-sensing regulator/GCU-specific mRNA interferase toxin
VTDKKRPTYDLEAFKEASSKTGAIHVTRTATMGAAQVGFGRQEIMETIRTMDRSQFYKSMTSDRDHTVWQDVYHVPSPAGPLYVKFTAGLITEFTLLSFKEK